MTTTMTMAMAPSPSADARRTGGELGTAAGVEVGAADTRISSATDATGDGVDDATGDGVDDATGDGVDGMAATKLTLVTSMVMVTPAAVANVATEDASAPELTTAAMVEATVPITSSSAYSVASTVTSVAIMISSEEPLSARPRRVTSEHKWSLKSATPSRCDAIA